MLAQGLSVVIARSITRSLTNLAISLAQGGLSWVAVRTSGRLRRFARNDKVDKRKTLCNRQSGRTRAYPLSTTCHCERSVAISLPEEPSLSPARLPRRFAPRNDKVGTRESRRTRLMPSEYNFDQSAPFPAAGKPVPETDLTEVFVGGTCHGHSDQARWTRGNSGFRF